MSKKITYFYEEVNGKTLPYQWKKREKELYEVICSMIWGGYPLDVNWATSTNLYQSTLKLVKNGNSPNCPVLG